jgi:hypothetical protein
MKRLLSALLVTFMVAGIAFAGSQATSSTAASTIITNARYYLNEDVADFWTAAELLVWVNDGIVDVAGKTRAMESTEDITLVTDTLEYTLSNDYITIAGAIYISGTTYYKGLKRGSVKDVGHFEDIDEPEYYYEWNGKVGIYPLAESATTGDTVTIYLVERPSAVTVDQNVPTPAHYDKALTLYVAAQGFLKDRQIGRYKNLMDLYHAELERYRADYGEQPKDKK